MNIDKLARLFAGQEPSARFSAKTKTKAELTEQPSKDSEAVTLAKNFGQVAAAERDVEDRQAKVQRLKQEVASGNYGRDSKEIAEAVARELFA